MTYQNPKTREYTTINPIVIHGCCKEVGKKRKRKNCLVGPHRKKHE
jgi:hypothetical protein